MSFYDDASIVMIPSGYKTSKLYSQKPTDGSGDLTFTRTGSTATRVNESGLIEKCRTNHILRSEQFNEANWTKTRLTVSADSTASPINTNTADKLVEDTTATSSHFIASLGQNIGAGGTFSIYAKAGERSRIGIRESTATGVYATYNLLTGAVIDSGGGASSATITSVGSGWYRLQMVYSASINVNFAIFILDNIYTTGNPNAYQYTGDGTSGLFVWGAQLETADIATDYIPTTTAAVTVGPIANLPRLDYTGGGCPKLLMEPTRTNLALFSEQFNNAAWTKQNTLVTANATTSPDGYINADKLISSATNSFHGIYNFNAVITGSYTTTFYAKKSEYSFIKAFDQFSSIYNAVFNLDNGTVSGSGASIQSVGNGWYRCIISFVGVGTGVIPTLTPVPTLASSSTYLGDGISGVFIYGAQLEAAAYATSYIPTLNATVTRNADSCSKTSISSLIGQTEGTLFAELNLTLGRSIIGPGNGILEILDSARANTVTILKGASVNQILLVLRVNSVNTFITAGSYISGTNKIAFAYKSGQNVCYVNGILAAISSLSFTFSASLDTINVGAYTTNVLDDSISQTILFKTRLSNADLATLTTL